MGGRSERNLSRDRKYPVPDLERSLRRLKITGTSQVRGLLSGNSDAGRVGPTVRNWKVRKPSSWDPSLGTVELTVEWEKRQ